MATARRLYVYGVVLVALETWLWGLSGVFTQALEGSIRWRADALAGALAGFLIGLLVFGLHWYWAQREAAADAEERHSAVRAWAVYAALLLTWGVAFHAAAAMLARMLEDVIPHLLTADLFPEMTWERAVAVMVPQALMGWYFDRVVAAWGDDLTDDQALARRWYRFAWLSYTAVWLILGLQFLLDALLPVQGVTSMSRASHHAAQGVVLAVSGAVLWGVWARRWWREIFRDDRERNSEVVAGFLMLWALAGLAVALTVLAIAVNAVLQLLLHAGGSREDVYDAARRVMVVGVPWGLLWLSARSGLAAVLRTWEDARQATAYRLLLSVVALAGLGVTSSAVLSLAAYVTDAMFANAAGRDTLAVGLTMALFGLPLWVMPWRALQAEARADASLAQSLLRRGYLYLVLFVALLAGMGFATALVFQVLKGALGGSFKARAFFFSLANALWAAGLLVYHARVLQRERKQLLAARAEAPTVKVLALTVSPEETWPEALQVERLPLALSTRALSEPPPEEADYGAVLLSKDALLALPAPWQAWLRAFEGERLVLSGGEETGWLWLGARGSTAASVRKTLRALAEHKRISGETCSLKWKVLGYVGIFALVSWAGGFVLSLLLTILTTLLY